MPESRYEKGNKEAKPKPDRSNHPDQAMNKGQEHDDLEVDS